MQMSVRSLLLAGAVACAMAAPARAQDAQPLSSQSVAAEYRAIVDNGRRPAAENSLVHIHPTPAARASMPASVRSRNNFHNFEASRETVPTAVALSQSRAAGAAFPAPALWNPDDLVNYGGVPANKWGVAAAKQINLYVNCTSDACWGNGAGAVTGFQTALNASSFIAITNQYVQTSAGARYPLGPQYYWKGTIPSAGAPFTNPVLLDSQAQALAASAASAAGIHGYGAIYHVFLPKGTDVCFDGSNVCYSPDAPANFYFCGYHGSFDTPAGHVLYTVEPYAFVPGCFINGMSATDAQASVLSHETFETITDPDPNNQWSTSAALINTLGEIGDECAWRIYNVPLVVGRSYNIQLEYDNARHACASAP